VNITDDMWITVNVPCPTCKGTGREVVPAPAIVPCFACHGQQYRQVGVTIAELRHALARKEQS
jgi:DnaJ-class molecular chaperone